MRILYVTNGFPYPLTSGYLRHYFFIMALAEFHRITLLSVVGAGFGPQHAEAMAPYTERILTFAAGARGGGTARKLASRVQGALRGLSEFRQMRSAVEQLAREQAFEAVVFSGKPTYHAIAGLALPPIIADMCDAASLRLEGQSRYVGRLRRAVLWLDAQQMRRTERAILHRTDHVVFASVRDRQALVGSSSPRATVLPNGVDLEFWRRCSNRLGRDTVVFTGAMNYAPNLDAALHLINDIMPLVRRAIPRARVLVVGHSPPPALTRLAGPGVVVTGFVEDVRPYLEQATLFVAPLRFAAGIQNKLLEALSMEVPAVTSPVVADGLRTEEGDRPPVQVAETPDEYARTIVGQLARRRSRPGPDAEGRRYVARHFSWERSGERLNGIIECAVRARPSVGSA